MIHVKANVKKLVKANYQLVTFVFLAFLAMVLVSYFYVSNIVQGQMLVIGEEMMNTTETAVSANLRESELSFANTVHTVESMLSSGKSQEEILDFLTEITDYFRGEYSPLPDFMKIYGYIHGEFLDGSGWVPPADYSPPQRPWYIGADKNDGGIFFSEPYVDAETGGTVISYSQKLRDDDGAEHGILAIDLNMTRVTDYVRGQKITGNGYGILLSDTLNFATHRDNSLTGLHMAEAGHGYAKLSAMLAAGQPISAERFTDADGTDSIAFFRTILNGWHIGIVTPRASYYGQVYSLALVLGILGAVLMVFLSAILIQINAAKIRSDEENRSKSGFLARMSHEMRTPMNAIIGMTSLARETDDLSRIRYCLDKVSDASSHLLGVINDVLDMSKIEAGKLELSETDFPFGGMLDQVTSVINFKLEEKHQHFTVEVDPEVPAAIVADRQRLSQVITNLLSNANKFTPEGGNIGLQVRRTGGEDGMCALEIAVTDDGIGISDEQKAKLFRAFEQADGSISRKFGGTGLGLSISKSIVELMGGGIRVESEPGKGSRFIFDIRVRTGSADPAGEEEVRTAVRPEDVAPVFAGKHILLAEDVEINREILLALLEDTGVAIDCAENGREACEMFADNDGGYDMIFMDIHMPEVDGYEATRRIRAMELPGAATIPIVAMTANVFREDIEKCLAAGMNAHVGKPLEMTEVLGKMRQYLL